MGQFQAGLGLFLFLALPPVANFMESVMIIHMHMQMPLLVIAGILMAPYVQSRFPRVFDQWNAAGLPGILLFAIITGYWLIPRTMDEALALWRVEAFKFFSLPMLAGIPLRDSWKKLGTSMKRWTITLITAVFTGMGLLYIYAPVQLCNNYLLIEQVTLGWSFLLTAIGLMIYLVYSAVVDPAQYEGTSEETQEKRGGGPLV